MPGRVVAAEMTGSMSPAWVGPERLHFAADHGIIVTGAHGTPAGSACANGVSHAIGAS